MSSTQASMDQFSQSLIADPPVKNPYFGLPDIANILTPRDEVAKIRAKKKTPNTLIGLYGQADSMTAHESTEFILQIILHGNQHSQGFTPDWKAVAAGLGVAHGHHIKKRFELLLKYHGFSISREGVISGRGNIVASAEAEADADAIADARTVAMNNKKATAETSTEVPTSSTSTALEASPNDPKAIDLQSFPPFVPELPTLDNHNIDPSLLLLRDSTSSMPNLTNAYLTNTTIPFSPPYFPSSRQMFSTSTSTKVNYPVPGKPAPFSATNGFTGLSRGQGKSTQHLPLSPATAAAMSKCGMSPVIVNKSRGDKKNKNNKRDAAELVAHDAEDLTIAPQVKKKRGRPPKNTARAAVAEDNLDADLVGIGAGVGKGKIVKDSIEFDA